MTAPRSAVAVSLAAIALLAGCGTAASEGARVRASYARLLHALASRDARTSCELMLPVGQDRPRSALIAAAHRLATASAAAAYRRYVASCAAETNSFSGYYKILRGSQLGAISISGSIATAAVTFASKRHGTATFVNAAGAWRLVIGVE